VSAWRDLCGSIGKRRSTLAEPWQRAAGDLPRRAGLRRLLDAARPLRAVVLAGRVRLRTDGQSLPPASTPVSWVGCGVPIVPPSALRNRNEHRSRNRSPGSKSGPLVSTWRFSPKNGRWTRRFAPCHDSVAIPAVWDGPGSFSPHFSRASANYAHCRVPISDLFSNCVENPRVLPMKRVGPTAGLWARFRGRSRVRPGESGTVAARPGRHIEMGQVCNLGRMTQPKVAIAEPYAIIIWV